MRITKGNEEIFSLTEWGRIAPPKKAGQWKEGRSAWECARSWIGSGAAVIPPEVRALLESCAATRDLQVDEVRPELPIRFDDCGGEPRNADVAFIGEAASGRVAVTIEAKADEPFDLTLEKTLANARKRLAVNPASQGVRRLEQLVQALFGVPPDGFPEFLTLRYQLLTAAAGTLAYATQHNAALAVLIVHEFKTSKTKEAKHLTNEQDFQAFLSRLAPFSDSKAAATKGDFAGAYMAPGNPLFSTHPVLFIGKVTVDQHGGT